MTLVIIVGMGGGVAFPPHAKATQMKDHPHVTSSPVNLKETTKCAGKNICCDVALHEIFYDV